MVPAATEGPSPFRRCPATRRPAGTPGRHSARSTTAGSSTMPVASASSRTCGPEAATTSWPAPCAFCATSSTAARRAPTRTPATAPASSPRSPTRSSARSPGSPCPRRAATPPAWPSCPSTHAERERAFARIADLAADEGLTVLGWRDVPVNNAACGAGASRRCRTSRSCSWPARRRRAASSSTGWRSACASGPSTRRASTSRQPVLPDHRLQGHAVRAAGRAVLPRPVRRALRVQPRPGPLPVLHQHVPVLAAVAPVPLRRAQRRDQHRAGQQELDARPRGDARVPADPGVEVGPGHRAAVPDHRPGRLGLRARSTSAWNCSTSAAGRCRTRCS